MLKPSLLLILSLSLSMFALADDLTLNKNAPKSYIVKKGDTLYSVSKKYTISIDQLIKLNKIKDNTIYLGQILNVSNL